MASSNFFRSSNRMLSFYCKYNVHIPCNLMSAAYSTSSSKNQETNYLGDTQDIIFPNQILESFGRLKEKNLLLDFTFGCGGHTQLILDNIPSSRVIAVDRDNTVRDNVQTLKKKYPNRLCFLNIKFSDVVSSLSSMGIEKNSISGAVIDCGPSLSQIYNPRRGFNTGNKWQIDMRMDSPATGSPSALDILTAIDEESLFKVLKYYGQHRNAKKIAYALVQSRYQLSCLRTPDDLINFIKVISGLDTNTDSAQVTPEFTANDSNSEQIPHEDTFANELAIPDKIHSSAVSVFRALRMLVNDELNELDCAIKSAHYLLCNDAPLAVVTYNPLEDTIVKRHFTGMNIDASPNTIGKQHHRTFKVAGLVDHNQCLPWGNLNKLILKSKWNQEFKHDHWKSAILRTASKINDVSYDS